SAKAHLQVLDQPAGPEALVIGRDDLHDTDLARFQLFFHGRLELAQVVTKQAARHADTGHSLWHVRQYFDHRMFSFSLPLGSPKGRLMLIASHELVDFGSGVVHAL